MLHIDDGNDGMEKWDGSDHLWATTWVGKQMRGFDGDETKRKQMGDERCQAFGPAKTPIRSYYSSDGQLLWVPHPSPPPDCRHVCRIHHQFRCQCPEVELVDVASTGAWRASSVGSVRLWESLSQTSSLTLLPSSSCSRRAIWRIWTRLQWTTTLRWELTVTALRRMWSAWDSSERCRRTLCFQNHVRGWREHRCRGRVGVVDVVTSLRCTVSRYLSIARILELWCWVRRGVWVLSITSYCFGSHLLLMFGKWENGRKIGRKMEDKSGYAIPMCMGKKWVAWEVWRKKILRNRVRTRDLRIY